MTTKWSDPAVCFNGKRPAEIPEGVRVQVRGAINGFGGPVLDWSTHSDIDALWASATHKNPITYRYELPPVETEPFAVVFYKNGDRYVDFMDFDCKKLRNSISRRVENEECTVRFYDKHGNQVEPEALEEAGG